MTTLTSIKTTVVLEYTTASIIRSVARKDIPEYGLTEGQVFYLALSETESKAQGKNVYHILTWNYAEVRWNCPCKATILRCKHNKAVTKDCAKQHTLQGYKPVSKAGKFARLFSLYDVRSQAQAIATARHAQIMAEMEAARKSMTTEDLESCIRQDLAYTFGGDLVLVEASIAQEQARRIVAEREAQARATAPLNGNRAFSLLRI